MTTAYFDSHKYAKRLIGAGVPPATADVMTEAMFELACRLADLVSRGEGIVKADGESLAAINSSIIDSKISMMGHQLRSEIARSEIRTTRWVGICIIGIMYLLQFILIASIPS